MPPSPDPIQEDGSTHVRIDAHRQSTTFAGNAHEEAERDSSDVLVFTGQGVWNQGRLFAEFADRDVYFGHAMNTRKIVEKYRYTDVVLSGGYTQRDAPQVSEAGGYLKLFEEFREWPVDRKYIVLDAVALDSSENVMFALMAARVALGTTPIRRIGIWNSWKFKKRRFNLVASELGFETRFYFHGYASYEEATSGLAARQGEEEQYALISDDPLMLGSQWEAKRRRRYQGATYDDRLKERREQFPRTFEAISGIRMFGRTDQTVQQLRTSFSAEVLLG